MYMDDPYNMDIISENEAISIALQELPGTVINVELDDDFDGLVYEVELMSMGNRYEVTICAYTGRILDIEETD